MKNNTKKTLIPIKGMHCKSCELLIQKHIGSISGVRNVKTDFKKGEALIDHDGSIPFHSFESAIRKSGYEIGTSDIPWISKNARDYKDSFMALVFIIALYFVLKELGVFNLQVDTNNINVFTPLFVGLIAGVSTCMALIGGLVLGISARWSEEHPEYSGIQKFRPHLLFNAGRVIGFALLGGIMGLVGSAFHLSHIFLSLLTIFVGLTMMILGIKLTELFPRINKISITLPSGISRIFGAHKKENDAAAPLLSGALTFFLPCGFTQAMQLFALSTGNMMSGALIMGFFALGTVPGLLGVGGLASFMKGQAAKLFFKMAGITVILLGIFSIQNGWYVFANNVNTPVQQNNTITVDGNAQEVRMTESAYGYSPSEFTVKQNVPVRWIINAQDVFSCASSLVLPKFGISKQLQKGENIIEFTPTETGDIPFSCSMGMYRGLFHVTSNGESQRGNGVTPTANAGYQVGGGGCGMMQGKSGEGCGGCGGGKSNYQLTEQVPAEVSDNTQVLKAVYTAQDDIQPNNFTVKKGVPALLEIDVQEDGSGCMSTITIQNLVQNVERLQKDKKIMFDFTPDTVGTYLITCAMGVPRGTITVK